MPQSAPEGPLLSVVVPTRNEAGNVEALVGRLGVVLAGVPTELIFVDDSSDQTTAILERISAAPPEGITLRVLHRPPPQQTGLGSAAAEGFKLASGHLVAVIDGDLQHPPELLTTMIQALEEGDLDVVVASRYVRGGSARGLNGPARVAVSGVSKVLAQMLFREARKTTDPLSGYFLFRRSAIEGLEFRPIGFKILLEVLVCATGTRVGDVPLTFDRRHAGTSNASMAQGVAYLRHLWSLLAHVPGSARFWKYATVGAAGLAIFLGILTVADEAHVAPILAWGAAFGASLFLNWQLNRLVTFADVASPFTAGRGRPIYLPVALMGGAANLVVFVALVLLHTQLVVAGLGGALVAMAVNYAVHRGILSRPPRVASDHGRQRHAIVERVAALVPAEVELLAAPADEMSLYAMAIAEIERPPLELLRTVQTRKPLLLAEAPSSKVQARTDIGVSAWMAVPIVEGSHFVGLLVLQRHGRPFGGEELDTVLRTIRSESRDSKPALTPLLSVDERASR
ncbi:MAG: glycosyltransferase [Candidatus Dormibacteria bacterium]